LSALSNLATLFKPQPIALHEGENLDYLNTMVNVADKEMVAALAKRYKVSQGFVMRAILEQWRDMMLSDCK
jgi:hypothetical protein